MSFMRAAVTFCCLVAAVGCKNGRQAGPLPSAVEAGAASVSVPVEGRTVHFRVEVARTPEERAQGLMYREQLAPDAGMLFLFARPETVTFWMKNTFIPLDMVFMDTARRIVGIVENAEPRTLTPRGVAEPSQFVLEINGGLSARLGIRKGTVVEFRGVPLP